MTDHGPTTTTGPASIPDIAELPADPATAPRATASRAGTSQAPTDRAQRTPGPASRKPARRARGARRNAAANGAGAVRQLDSGRWQARYTDSDGVRRPAPITFATRTEAENWITTHRAGHLLGLWRSPEVGAFPLAEYLRDYLASRVDLSPRTAAAYADLAARYLLADLTHPSGRAVCLGGVQLRDLTPLLIRDWHAAALSGAQRRALARIEASDRHRQARAVHAARRWAQETGYPVKRTGRLSPDLIAAWKKSGAPAAATLDLPATEPPRNAGQVTVARAYALLRLVLGTAHRDGLIPANPCTLRGVGAGKAPERPHATPEEVARLAVRMPPRYAAAVWVAAWSGLRAGELFALTRAHVNIEAGTVRVERALVELNGHPVRFGPPKTAASLRTVHLPRPVADLLAEHLATFTAAGPDALVFCREDGKPLRTAERTRMFRTACAAEGLHRLHWHDLRHTGATMAAQAGASLRELQARLGHSTVAAAMTYQHATAERDRELADRMAAQIAPALPAPRALRMVKP